MDGQEEDEEKAGVHEDEVNGSGAPPVMKDGIAEGHIDVESGIGEAGGDQQDRSKGGLIGEGTGIVADARDGVKEDDRKYHVEEGEQAGE